MLLKSPFGFSRGKAPVVCVAFVGHASERIALAPREAADPAQRMRGRRFFQFRLSVLVPGCQSGIHQFAGRLERRLYIHFARIEQVRIVRRP